MNFDQYYEVDRTFILGGGVFHWRPLHWREWGETIDAEVAEEKAADARRMELIEQLIAGGKDRLTAELEVDTDDETVVASMQRVVNSIVRYLEPDDEKSFRAVVDDKEKRVTIQQLNALLVWLREVQTPDRPTTAPAASLPGPGTPGATS